MKRVKQARLSTFGALAFVLLSVGCTSPIASDAWPDKVLQADRFRSDAMVDANPIQLERVLHDRLTYAHSNGVIDTKNSLVAALISNAIDYQSIEPKSRAVRMNGRTAIVTGLVHIKVAGDKQVREMRSLYTAAYWLIEERWQLVAYQSTNTGPQ